MRRAGRLGAGLSLNSGFDIGADPPPVSFVTPTLDSWQVTVTDTTPAAEIDYEATTLGTACTVRFILKKPVKIVYAGPYSSPAQNTPHTSADEISAAADRGAWYDLYWHWYITEVLQSADILIGSGLIYIPAVGEGSDIYSG